MNTVIATWLHAKENKDVNKTHTNTEFLDKEDGTRHKVCLFFNLLLQIFSPIFKSVLVFFVIFLKIKIRSETTENMLAASANII